MKIKLLYYAPFLLTVVVVICYGIPETLSFVFGCLFTSIFIFELRILVLCLSYVLYFLMIGKYFNKTVASSFQAALKTIALLGIFLLVSLNIYEPIENIVYFTNETKTELTKRSLNLYQERMKTKGKVEGIYQTSKMHGWGKVEVNGLAEGRILEIYIMPIKKEDKRSVDFYYLYIDGKWRLERTEAFLN
ncbi:MULTISPECIES: hypothetical protein [Bacillaceae]|uniref:DUF4878 domain-containing protein n=1 Tax=Gottfriedia luciferensis TaxID=178774 RepID=A0ABX2ZL35_9BACI|nr:MULTISPECIES: hypothetical protein [Bacillaceae]ODG90112.1 hypothetical protein BED47_12285 [Gottfriedia luciferensis]SFC96229.1 hypothetical protein SAMN02799633_02161 [Bacillus sp. UNCCL81]